MAKLFVSAKLVNKAFQQWFTNKYQKYLLSFYRFPLIQRVMLSTMGNYSANNNSLKAMLLSMVPTAEDKNNAEIKKENFYQGSQGN